MTLPFPLPDPADPMVAPFWQAAACGELRLPRKADGGFDWYPTGVPVEWVPLSGRARLYSWATVRVPLDPRYAGIVPYVAAIVVPIEAPDVKLVTRLVDIDVDLVADMALELSIRDIGSPGATLGVPAPFFRPIAD